jgi:hypothetical protein
MVMLLRGISTTTAEMMSMNLILKNRILREPMNTTILKIHMIERIKQMVGIKTQVKMIWWGLVVSLLCALALVLYGKI